MREGAQGGAWHVLESVAQRLEQGSSQTLGVRMLACQH